MQTYIFLHEEMLQILEQTVKDNTHLQLSKNAGYRDSNWWSFIFTF